MSISFKAELTTGLNSHAEFQHNGRMNTPVKREMNGVIQRSCMALAGSVIAVGLVGTISMPGAAACALLVASLATGYFAWNFLAVAHNVKSIDTNGSLFVYNFPAVSGQHQAFSLLRRNTIYFDWAIRDILKEPLFNIS